MQLIRHATRSPVYRHARWWIIGCLLALSLAACRAAEPPGGDRAIVVPAVAVPTTTAPTTDRNAPTVTPDMAPVRDSGWQPLFPGAEVRTYVADRAMTALRLAPAAVDFAVAYTTDPNAARTVDGWLRNSSALAAVNCGFYFTDEQQQNHAIGLLAGPEGVLSTLRPQWGGVLLVDDHKGWVQTAPAAQPGPVRLGVQGWPMLVRNRTPVSRLDATNPDARTVVAQDDQGRIIFLVDIGGVSLASLAQFLLASDMGIVHAVNLDGGSSTGLRYRSRADAPAAGYDSFWVPCALLIRPAP